MVKKVKLGNSERKYPERITSIYTFRRGLSMDVSTKKRDTNGVKNPSKKIPLFLSVKLFLTLENRSITCRPHGVDIKVNSISHDDRWEAAA